MLQSDDVGVHDTGGGLERVDGGVEAQLGDLTRQHGGGVQVREGGGRRGIGQIVSGHVDGLFQDFKLSRLKIFRLKFKIF